MTVERDKRRGIAEELWVFLVSFMRYRTFEFTSYCDPWHDWAHERSCRTCNNSSEQDLEVAATEKRVTTIIKVAKDQRIMYYALSAMHGARRLSTETRGITDI